jgi:Uma2 family endonuclease
MLRTISPSETEYAESDDTPMAETDIHRTQITDALIHPLQERYRERDDVYVSGNLFLYYERDNPGAVVAPDVFVVFGVPKRERRVYKLWQEPKAPDVVFELTSRKTYQDDLSRKRLLYEELGIREYILFDPLRDYLRPPLQGFRLTKEGYYAPLMPQPFREEEWQLPSDMLGLLLRSEGPQLRLYDPAAAAYLRTPAEAEEALRAAEEEIARLRALLDEQTAKDD